MVLRLFNFRGIDEIVLQPETMWGPIFKNYNMENEITISVKRDNQEETMVIKFNPNYSGQSIPVTPKKSGTPEIRTDQKGMSLFALDIRYKIKGEKDQVSHLVAGPQTFGLQVEFAKANGIPAVFLGARTRTNPNEDANRFGQLDVMGKQDEIVDLLKVIEPRLKGVSSITIGNNSLIHADIGIGRKVPIAMMGDGMSRLLSIILAISSAKNGIVLIDEIENGIHYSVMPQIWESIGKAARVFDCQIIATTHSYECLKASYKGLSGELERDFSYTRLERVKEKMNARTFDHVMLGAALEQEWEVR